jgi:hypothetical protein
MLEGLGSLIWIKSSPPDRHRSVTDADGRKGRLPAPFGLLNLHTNRESCISKGDRKPPSPQTLAPSTNPAGAFLLFANEPELDLFVVHTEGERGKGPPLPAAVVCRGYWCGPAVNNSALSNHSHRLLTIASVRILPVRAQAPVIAFPERLRVHVRMQLGSRNHASRLKRWHC